MTRKLRRTVESAYRKFSGSWRPHPDELREPIEAARALAERWSERLQLPARAPGRAAEVLAETPVSLGATDPLRAEAREGTGMQSLALLMLLGAVLEAENGSPVDSGAESLVLIEEAEAHLHPILAARIFRLIDRVPGQKVLTTNSGDLLASVPLHAIRRLVRSAAGVSVHAVPDDALTVDEMRRVGYHIRVNRASSVFARCWLLVEGETESWLLPEVARLVGFDFPAEGIRCVEFAQCGIAPLVKMARGLGIQWHLLADGDDAGRHYVRAARSFLAGEPDRERVTGLSRAGRGAPPLGLRLCPRLPGRRGEGRGPPVALRAAADSPRRHHRSRPEGPRQAAHGPRGRRSDVGARVPRRAPAPRLRRREGRPAGAVRELSDVATPGAGSRP